MAGTKHQLQSRSLKPESHITLLVYSKYMVDKETLFTHNTRVNSKIQFNHLNPCKDVFYKYVRLESEPQSMFDKSIYSSDIEVYSLLLKAGMTRGSRDCFLLSLLMWCDFYCCNICSSLGDSRPLG